LKDALDLFFELSSDDRLQILLTLEKEPSKLVKLSTETDRPNQEVSRNLARLSALDLCYRDSNGFYNVTPYAEFVLKLLPGYIFLSESRKYFRTHTAGNLPTEFQLRIGELSQCQPISDISTIIYEIQQTVTEAENYIWSIGDQGAVWLAPYIEDAIRRGVENRFIMPQSLIPSEPFKQYMRSCGPDHPFRSNRAFRRFLDGVPIIIFMSEKEVPTILFRNTDGRFDNLGFKAKEGDAMKWCVDVFSYYWNAASDRVPPTLQYLFT
jgi:predicted transcriptional regulator